ncbi:hypothetical protein B7463_g1303, partial [Scytalidium lignicola]
MVFGLILLAVTGTVVYKQQKKNPNSRLNRYKAKKAAKKNGQLEQTREMEEGGDLNTVDTSAPLPPPYHDFGDEKELQIHVEEVAAPEIPVRSSQRVGKC